MTFLIRIQERQVLPTLVKFAADCFAAGGILVQQDAENK
jgi:hypothetical protein